LNENGSQSDIKDSKFYLENERIYVLVELQGQGFGDVDMTAGHFNSKVQKRRLLVACVFWETSIKKAHLNFMKELGFYKLEVTRITLAKDKNPNAIG